MSKLPTPRATPLPSSFTAAASHLSSGTATVYAYLTQEYGPPLNFEGLPRSLITYHYALNYELLQWTADASSQTYRNYAS